ncbi:MAG: hypothetical protein P4L43_15350 [Syntrophobacteraceae bacterium]|nr:hypothetical protein [Syntrophobacteraceae bacterium]
MITLDSKVEDLVKIPGVLTYCITQGVSLITCSDVFPDTLAKLLEIKKVKEPGTFVARLNDYLQNLQKQPPGK